MKKWTFLLLVPALFACKAIKTVKILKQGEVTQKEFKTEIPFEYRLGLIILKVKLQGETFDFVLDTGAPNVISVELAEKLNITDAVNRKTKDSQGGNSKLGFTEIKDIEIGGIHFTRTGAAIADLRQSKEIACLKIDGFIGANLMKKAYWQFDYQKQVITIASSKSAFDIPEGAKTISFRQQVTGTPLIDIDYNGITDKNVTFDMGSNGDLNSSKKVYDALLKQNKIQQKTFGFGSNDSGLFGQSAGDTITYGIVPEVKFGDVVIRNQVVSFSEKKARTIGTKFFENHILIIDWVKEEITLIPVTPYSFSELRTFGFSPRFSDDKLVVGFLYNQSPAALQGIAINDQILEINGVNYRNFTAEMWCTVINKGLFPTDVNTISILVSKDGKEKAYTLEKKTILEVAK